MFLAQRQLKKQQITKLPLIILYIKNKMNNKKYLEERKAQVQSLILTLSSRSGHKGG